ncbi:hypothetical protein FLL45_01400 [Aliikangiella marina]|uniref:Nucleotide modification associated domain-containing protein n=1 Tax=Aliikangiella marina TaxID=1712262 RepID=A0A545THF2_9GAMM|nr:hypothetical protein [Aliikangiella marina]TQV76642.1 hypothetical protein FLL45_01400 [Aliikangiella marina]
MSRMTNNLKLHILESWYKEKRKAKYEEHLDKLKAILNQEFEKQFKKSINIYNENKELANTGYLRKRNQFIIHIRSENISIFDLSCQTFSYSKVFRNVHSIKVSSVPFCVEINEWNTYMDYNKNKKILAALKAFKRECSKIENEVQTIFMALRRTSTTKKLLTEFPGFKQYLPEQMTNNTSLISMDEVKAVNKLLEA